MRVTRHEEFEVAHLLPFYKGPCGNLHGHSYKIEVTVEGPCAESFNMVMDFTDLKEAIKNSVPDHKFVFYSDDPISFEISKVLDKYNLKYEIYPFYTTAENMVALFAQRINDYIHKKLEYSDAIYVSEVKLWETSNSYAEWRKENE